MNIGESIFKAFYEVVRRNNLLNHLAHKVMQSEWVHHFPVYRWIYKSWINNKVTRVIEKPTYLEITLTDACNARCVMCPPEVHLGTTIMSHNLFEKLVREAREIGIEKMILTGGEPLLDKRLVEKIKFAKGHGFSYIHMFTNGALMTERRAFEIISSGLDSLTWSIDSPRKEEYERIRVGLDFDNVISNISKFIDIRKKMNSDYPLTRVNMVALPENRTSRIEFRKVFKGKVDIVEIMDSHNWAGIKDELTSGPGKEYFQLTRYPCHLLFTKVVVTPLGIIKKCSIDFSEHGVIGDLKKQTLKAILHDKRLMSIKRAHLNYDFSEPGCDICTHKESWWVKPF